jgi:hypothetical protein
VTLQHQAALACNEKELSNLKFPAHAGCLKGVAIPTGDKQFAAKRAARPKFFALNESIDAKIIDAK